MFSSVNCLLSCVILLLYSPKTCTGELSALSLVLYAPGEPEWTDVLVRRVDDSLELVCELRGERAAAAPRLLVWNYVGGNASDERPFSVQPAGAAPNSTLRRARLRLADSGHYMCSAPPFSVSKYVAVQGAGPKFCGRGTFWCGLRCMAAHFVCDGRADCLDAEDEAPHMCPPRVCARADRLNCSDGRCIPEAMCCRADAKPCQQPDCCYEHRPRLEGYVDLEHPPLYEDRHAPDDYGFIQSTIYTVTACALIFMLAVVLLVSAICKMHMKRAALRSYAHAERATRHHYNLQYAQAARFPPCYEASRLLEAEAAPAAPVEPLRDALQCETECGAEGEASGDAAGGFGLARLSAIFSSRYRQVPTQSDVELTNVRSTSLNNSPTRTRTLDNYRSPTYCDLNTAEFLFSDPASAHYGRDLNCLGAGAAPPDRARLTLQLGRFQLSLPRLARPARRPDTPTVPPADADDADFVRLAAHDTYTLNGRTIRLLGADLEHYPPVPPPYAEAVRCKFLGPPPEYLSRERLTRAAAAANVEEPPRYDDLSADPAPVTDPAAAAADNCANNNVVPTISSIINNLPAIDSDVNANDTQVNC